MSKKKVRPPSLAELEEEAMVTIIGIFQGSDTSYITTCGGLLEHIMRLALESFLRQSDVAERLFDPLRSGVLGTFAARADLLYCLEAIDTLMHKDLRKVAKIRNSFAHSYFELRFSEPQIQRLCEELQIPNSPYAEHWRELLSEANSPHELAKSRFQSCVATLYLHLKRLCDLPEGDRSNPSG